MQKSLSVCLKREQSLFKLSEEVVEGGQSNAAQSDWCWSQCVVGGGGGVEGPGGEGGGSQRVRVQWCMGQKRGGRESGES